MSDPTIDEYARRRTAHDEQREARDDTGRPIDHRPAPGAFEEEPRGPTIASMEVRPEEEEFPTQTDAVHHPVGKRDPALAYPTPARPDDAHPAGDTAPPSRPDEQPNFQTEARRNYEAAPKPTENPTRDTRSGLGQAARTTEALGDRLDLLSDRARKVGVVQTVVHTIIRVNRTTADLLEAWIASPSDEAR